MDEPEQQDDDLTADLDRWQLEYADPLADTPPWIPAAAARAMLEGDLRKQPVIALSAVTGCG